MKPVDQAPRMRTEYREFRPPGALADHFLCFWTQTVGGSQGFYEHRVLPDACVDIVLVDEEPPVVVGPWTVPLLAQLPAGSLITGARLHPGRPSSLLGMPASALLNQAIPVAAVEGAMRNIPLEKVIEQPNAAVRRSVFGQVLRRSGTYDPRGPSSRQSAANRAAAFC